MRVLALAAFLAFGVQASADEPAPIPVPEGFVPQTLDFTKGSIARPKDWFYANEPTDSGWLWTIAKEDPAKGPYETGMHIQMFVGFTKYGMTPDGFIRDFIDRERKNATVLSDCAPSQAGMFERQCLEVLEADPRHPGAKFHIQYSTFWTAQGDMAFVVTFGTPEDKWEATLPIAKVMSDFIIIGKDFGKDLEEKKKE